MVGLKRPLGFGGIDRRIELKENSIQYEAITEEFRRLGAAELGPVFRCPSVFGGPRPVFARPAQIDDLCHLRPSRSPLFGQESYRAT